MSGKKGKSGRRKSGGPQKTAVFSTRLRPAIRKSLEKISDWNGRSMSQQIEAWVQAELSGRAYSSKIAFAGDRRNRALAALIAEAMKFFTNDNVASEQNETETFWMDIPVVFAAFSVCVTSLLEALAPVGEYDGLPIIERFVEKVLRIKPEENDRQSLIQIYGNTIAAMLLMDLKSGTPIIDPNVSFPSWEEVFPRIREDLKLDKKDLGVKGWPR